MRFLSIVAIGAALALSTPAMAQSVSCTRDAIFAGGGAWNFTCKEDPVVPGPNNNLYPFGRLNHCIPYAATNGNVPRGSAEAIAGWVRVVNDHKVLTFIDDGEAAPAFCPVVGSRYVKGFGTND
jgi:hypothetical protein